MSSPTLDDADGGAGVAAGDDDPEPVVADDAARVDLAQLRVPRVVRGLVRLGERAVAVGLLDRPARAGNARRASGCRFLGEGRSLL